MSPFTLLLSLCAVDTLSILSPGPNMLLVTRAAVGNGRRQALMVAGGLTIANLVWACTALAGFSLLFAVMPGLQWAVRLAGAAYLVHLGIRLLSPAGAPSVIATQAGPVALALVLRGFATSLLNPKALAYFGSIFVLFVPATAPLWMRLTAVGVVAADATLCYGLVALLLSLPAVRKAYLGLRRPIDRACGGLMIAFAAKLAL